MDINECVAVIAATVNHHQEQLFSITIKITSLGVVCKIGDFAHVLYIVAVPHCSTQSIIRGRRVFFQVYIFILCLSIRMQRITV